MRLIDADALFRNMERWYNNAERDEIAVELVANAPTVDAVEVVRCNDCKHYSPGTGLNAGHGWCNEPPLGTPLAVSEDFFCKYGKHKDGGEKIEENE